MENELVFSFPVKERSGSLWKSEYIFHLFAVLLISESSQTNTMVIGAESLHSSSLMSLNKVDLSAAGPEISLTLEQKKEHG